MRILEWTWMWDWWRTHGFALDESGDGPLPDPALSHAWRLVYSPNGRSGHEPAVAEGIVDALGAWDECLLWITDWVVWPSSEDWPRYYALRGRLGMKLSIADAPAHLVSGDERDALIDLLIQVLDSGWDAEILVARDERPSPVRVHLSHDGWCVVRVAEDRPPRVAGIAAEPVSAT